MFQPKIRNKPNLILSDPYQNLVERIYKNENEIKNENKLKL